MAVGNPDGPQEFREKFLGWKKTQPVKKKATGKGGDKGGKKKGSGKAADKASQGKSDDITGDALYQSDSWNELCLLRDQHGKLYNKIVGTEKEPDTLKKVDAAIESINAEIGSGMPA
jgi:hypothetical protein